MATDNSGNVFDRVNNVYKGTIEEYKLIDLSDIFERYIKAYIIENNLDSEKDEAFEDTIADIYLEWLDKYNVQLECKPTDYFKPFTDAQLIQILIKYVMAHVKLPDPLIEEVVLRKENTAPLIEKILEYEDGSHFSLDIKLIVMNILSEMQYPLPLVHYMRFIEKGNQEDVLAQTAYEIIDEQIEQKDFAKIIAAYDTTRNEYAQKTYIDIMARFYGNNDAYQRIIDAFLQNVTDDNVAFYAACLAKFGDDRAVKILEGALKDNEFNYLNFTAIKFAIEQLGTDINIDRAFDGDEAYELLKNMPEE